MLNKMRLCYFNSSVFHSSKRQMSKNIENGSFKYCMDSVRHYDHENFLSTLLLPSSLRACAVIIRAFNVEVARVPDQVSDPNIGLMRFQFWHDTLDKIYAKGQRSIPSHPIAEQLFKVSQSHKVSKRQLSRLINCRKNNITKKYYHTLDEMEKYAEESVSPIYYLLFEAAGVTNVHADHAASHLGKAQGLTNMLRSVEKCAQQRLVMLPTDVLLKNNVSQESVLRCTDNQEMRDAVFEVASRASQHLTKARSIVVQKEVKTILLPAVGVDQYLTKLQRNNFNLFNKELQMKNSILPLALYWNKLRSKY